MWREDEQLKGRGGEGKGCGRDLGWNKSVKLIRDTYFQLEPDTICSTASRCGSSISIYLGY